MGPTWSIVYWCNGGVGGDGEGGRRTGETQACGKLVLVDKVFTRVENDCLGKKVTILLLL